MPAYPWGDLKHVESRRVWLGENSLVKAFGEYRKHSINSGMSEAEAEEWASDKIVEDWEAASSEMKAHAPVREDWYWAFEHYGDDPSSLTKADAPSAFAWSLLVGARNSDPAWKSLQDKIAKDLFGGDVSDDDDRAFIATGMPSALRERFSGVLGQAKRLFAGQLPDVFGRPEAT